jgi:hypothetical protein
MVMEMSATEVSSRSTFVRDRTAMSQFLLRAREGGTAPGADVYARVLCADTQHFGFAVTISACPSATLYACTITYAGGKMPANKTDAFDYQERIVAFVDVLGFSELVEASEANPTARDKIDKLIVCNKSI